MPHQFRERDTFGTAPKCWCVGCKTKLLGLAAKMFCERCERAGCTLVRPNCNQGAKG